MSYSSPTADFQTGSLSGALTNNATSGTITTGLNLPATNGILQVDYDSVIAIGLDNGPETFSYAAYNSSTGAITGVVRGLAGTTGVAHDNGKSVQAGPTSLYLQFLGVWTAYTPTWAAAGTAVSLGNGTIGGRYIQIGNTVIFFINLSFGTTTTYGTGRWSLTIPVTSSGQGLVGNWGAYRDSAAGILGGPCLNANSNTFNMGSPNDVYNFLSLGVPFGWGGGDDAIYVSGIYEAA